MLRVEEISSEQIDSIIGTLDRALVMQLATEMQGIPPDKDLSTSYHVPSIAVGIKYNMAKTSTFVSEEHTLEWELEWNALLDTVTIFCENLNNLLKN